MSARLDEAFSTLEKSLEQSRDKFKEIAFHVPTVMSWDRRLGLSEDAFTLKRYGAEGVIITEAALLSLTAGEARAQNKKQDIDSLTDRVSVWIATRLAGEQTHRRIRALRLLEEAVELAQAEGITEEQAMREVQNVFARPVGQPFQEAGGVSVCLLGWCAATGNRFLDVVSQEVDRIEKKSLSEIRGSLARKQSLTDSLLNTKESQ